VCAGRHGHTQEALHKEGSFELTPRLQQTLQRMAAAAAVVAPSSPAKAGGVAPSGSGAPAAAAGNLAYAFTSSGNLYGLQERCVSVAAAGLSASWRAGCGLVALKATAALWS
jgi:hypothetical protein